ncbi:hypothetical protein [Acinetobacter silvestris]|uniref:Uncharacterized protein n=1 Tax=Acinetobacter silvestris TaxID=1977882 RepID=A0A1Y3CDR3_9GAMM|nr:hypothetical protein [Acinetobacter silvestris]OTG64790.1 hypothetical protein B9T28_11325 [Acinetobacter silvestris]
MKKFNLEIRYPHHLSEHDAEQFGQMDGIDVLIKFDGIKWRQQQIRQLQTDGANASFTVTDQTSKQSLRLTLNGYSKTNQLEFKIESDIQVIHHQKDLFGLITRKTKDYIAFKQLSLTTVRMDLLDFLEGRIEVLEKNYKNISKKSFKSVS